jgi:hypothetical protein
MPQTAINQTESYNKAHGAAGAVAKRVDCECLHHAAAVQPVGRSSTLIATRNGLQNGWMLGGGFNPDEPSSLTLQAPS